MNEKSIMKEHLLEVIESVELLTDLTEKSIELMRRTIDSIKNFCEVDFCESSECEPEAAGPDAAAAEEPPTMEELRGVLAEKLSAGHTDSVKALLEMYGAARLSELDSEHYAEVMKMAKEIGNE